MAAKLLVSLDVSTQVTIDHKSGGDVIHTERVSERELRAHLLLADSGDPATEPLGFVHVRVEMTPRSMPDMTYQQTLEWLCEALKKLL